MSLNCVIKASGSNSTCQRTDSFIGQFIHPAKSPLKESRPKIEDMWNPKTRKTRKELIFWTNSKLTCCSLVVFFWWATYVKQSCRMQVSALSAGLLWLRLSHDTASFVLTMVQRWEWKEKEWWLASKPIHSRKKEDRLSQLYDKGREHKLRKQDMLSGEV